MNMIIVTGIISVVIVLCIILYFVVMSSKSQSSQQPVITNQNIEVSPQTKTVNIKDQQSDPLTIYVNAAIKQEISDMPKPVSYSQKIVPSKQLNLDTLPPFKTQICKDANKGSFIEKIDIYSGKYVDGMQIYCSDDLSQYDKIGGSNGGLKVLEAPKQGINKLIIKSGRWIDSITYDQGNNQAPLVFGGSEGGGPYVIDCGPNGKLAGIQGTSGAFINQLDGICITPQN